MINAILSHLPASHPWRGNLHYFETLVSTNTAAKKMAAAGAAHGTVLIAEMQTGGRGRMGRSFHSPAGSGIYFSVILRPACPAHQLMHLTCAAAVAAAEGIEAATGLHAGIKWTNDLVFGKKKLGGILTELSLDTAGNAEFAILGIGINCAQNPEDFPADIAPIATSVAQCTGEKPHRALLLAELLVAIEKMSRHLQKPSEILQRYRKRCITIGQEISLLRADTVQHGTALDVDEHGGLLVRFADGQIETVQSGEVSIRGMYGYL